MLDKSVFFVVRSQVASWARISDMASLILSPLHPWARMWKLLSITDPNQLESLIHQTWQCATDAFEGALCRFHQLTVNYQTDLIYQIYRVRDPTTTERRLRSLLLDCERQCGTSNLSYLSILSTLGYSSLYQGKFQQAEALGMDLSQFAKATPQSGSLLYEISGLEIAARAQHSIGTNYLAEGGLREAVKMIGTEWGKDDPWAIEIMLLLEKWLLEWNRAEHADRLKAEVVELVGPDGNLDE